MLVRAIPSVSAFSLNFRIGADWLRKGTLLAFTIAGTTQGHLQRTLILIALSAACVLFLANLGCRAWYYLKWKPLAYNGPFANVLAYILAVGTGVVVPYMGHREVEVGGKAALESVLTSAVLVAVIFVVSAFAEVKKFIVLGLEVRGGFEKFECSTLYLILMFFYFPFRHANSRRWIILLEFGGHSRWSLLFSKSDASNHRINFPRMRNPFWCKMTNRPLGFECQIFRISPSIPYWPRTALSGAPLHSRQSLVLSWHFLLVQVLSG